MPNQLEYKIQNCRNIILYCNNISTFLRYNILTFIRNRCFESKPFERIEDREAIDLFAHNE